MKYILRIVVHDDRHTVHTQAVCLRHHTLSKPVRDMIGAEQSSKDTRYVNRNDRECDNIPPLQHFSLEFQIAVLAAG